MANATILPVSLTGRETEVLRCALADAFPTLDDIAGALGIGRNTVNFHFLNIYQKMGVHTRTEALAALIARGVSIDDLQGTKPVPSTEIIVPAAESPAGSAVLRPVYFAELSKREMEVLALLASGKTDRQIAEELKIMRATLRFTIANIFARLRVSNRLHAARVYFRRLSEMQSGAEMPKLVSVPVEAEVEPRPTRSYARLPISQRRDIPGITGWSLETDHLFIMANDGNSYVVPAPPAFRDHVEDFKKRKSGQVAQLIRGRFESAWREKTAVLQTAPEVTNG